MSIYEKQLQHRAEAMTPYLEPGETVRASFLAQTPVPPWVFLLVAPYVFMFMQKYRLVAATDRNVYVMDNKLMRAYAFNGVAYKAPLATAQIEFASTWMRVDGGAKLMTPPFGPLKRGLAELRAYVESQRGALPAQAGAPAQGAVR